MGIGWRLATQNALYGRDGFFVRADAGPADHFRTSVHASPLFASAIARLVNHVDVALGHPDPFDLVDVGAGRGELLTALHAGLGADLRDRIRLVGVEKGPRPGGLSAAIEWRHGVPDAVAGLLIATEWLDNVPIDLAEVDEDGRLRRVLVNRATGAESLGADVDAADRMWLARWWPIQGAAPGTRAEVGWPRDVGWADAVGAVRRGCALTIDYGHLKSDRPWGGTLTGFRGGRQVEPVPDGSCDVTAHVAMDSIACAAGTPYTLVSQRLALKALGVDGARPPLELARENPAAYLRGLSSAGAAAELIEPSGLGGHWWLLHTAGIEARGIIHR
jgi:SAM-dependent MidA family methyltransferase